MATMSADFASIGQNISEKSNIVGRLVSSISNSLKAARTFNELQSLTDVQLRDIGIYRSEITSIAFEQK